MDPGTSEGNADAAHGVRLHEGRGTPGRRGDSTVATRVLLVVLHGGSRDRARPAMSICMDSKAGEKIPRSLGEAVQGTRPGEILHFDCLYVGDSRSLGRDGLDGGDGFKYILVMLSNFMWSEPRESVE